MRTARHLIEAALIYSLTAFFAILPVAVASALGGAIGRAIGPRLAVNRRAQAHILKVWPDCPPARVQQIIIGMWDNLGRNFAEYPHLQTIVTTRCTFVGADIAKNATLAHGHAVVFSGHIANWEVCNAAYHFAIETPIHAIYRAPNNPFLTRLLDKMRSLNGRIMTIPKSTAGARAIVKAVRDKHSLALLIDQKYNQGIAVPFLGWMAMTTTAPVANAQKYKMPIIPVRCTRLPHCHFRVEVLPPIPAFAPDGTPRAETDVMTEMNDLLGHWIAERPEHWIWLHRRWSSQKVADLPRVGPAPPFTR